MRPKRRQKRSYLLLELLISITLLVLLAIPLLTSYPRQLTSKMKSLHLVQKERLSALLFTEIIDLLEKQKISWSQIPALKAEGKKISLGERSLLPNLSKVKTNFSFRTLQEKTETNGKINRLIAVKIFIDDTEFRYRLILSHA